MLESQKFDFNHLFTFEMANNHQGDVDHGKRIIREMANIAKDYQIKAAVKLQLRNLDSFIHPEYRSRNDLKHIPRFLSTALSDEQFRELVEETKKTNLITMATPFDESSVDLLDRLNIEIIKVASCSADDWPLLEKIANAGKPVIVSVGGLKIDDVDRLVSFFEHRGVHFALMHCVAIYPTPREKMFLKNIEILKNRYPKITVGFSTHEEPSNTNVIALAYAKGARIFEKHVGVPSEQIKLNAYSANPEQVRKWVESYLEAKDICAEELNERPTDEKEHEDLQSLKRCVFSKKELRAGQELTPEDVFFAIPLLSNDHLESGQFKKGLIADRDYKAGEPLLKDVLPINKKTSDIIYTTVHAVKGMLNNAKIPVGHDFLVEISHHYGLEKFHEVGCVIIDCINREYAKKLIIQLPGQWHPTHYHKLKDESFQILHGTLEVEVEGNRKTLYPGDTLWVPRGVWHSFRNDHGVIFEEISTTAHDASGDSYYLDKNISSMPRASRKTKLVNWGRHQFD